MASEKPPTSLLRTKLHRPPVADDHVHRVRLLEHLDENIQRPLTLVSASAGYGKSTLVSCWLEASSYKSAWLSLDKNDNDLNQFLTYFTTAIQNLFPDACPQTSAMLKSLDFPPMEVITNSLTNELDQIEDYFVLVLDDYHLIREQGIHDLLARLLEHPPKPLHLVVSCRIDPPLPLTTLRARGKMTEVRVQDLRFSVPETTELLQQALKTEVDDATAAVLEEKTEGWVTGLCLAALSLRRSDNRDKILAGLPEDNMYIMDYLVEEVLSQHPSDIQEYMLETSILDRFCAPLCEALHSGNTGSGIELWGQGFIERLEQARLFIVPLDDQHQWFRYHHLFQEMLKRRAKIQFSQDEIEGLYNRAGVWFTENGHFEEGLHNILKSGHFATAGQLVAQNRGLIMSEEGWHRLRNLIKMLPSEVVDNEPELLLAKAWSMVGFIELHTVLDKVEALLETILHETTATERLRGEFCTLRGLQHLLLGQSAEALNTAQRALEILPPERISERSFALIIMVNAYQMMGNLEAGRSIAFDGLKKKEHFKTTYHARMLIALCFAYWQEADLGQLMKTAEQHLLLGLESGLPESIAHAHSFLGMCLYERNELVEAEKHLVAVVQNVQVDNIANFVHSAFALALVYQALGRPKKAEETLDFVHHWALNVQFPSFLNLSEGMQAELLLRQGRVSEASQWTKTFNPYPFHGGYRFYFPQLTLAKVYIALNTEESQRKAEALLSSLCAFFTSTHNKMFLLKVMTLQALLRHVQGDEPAALSTLEEAVALGESGGFIRPFLDLGPDMGGLLNRLADRDGGTDYVKKLLAAFGAVTPHSPTPQSMLEPLTNREIEILLVLSKRFSNQEIAESLFISPETVKRHLYNIYQKFDVKTRKEAIARAKSLGIC